VGAWLVDGAVTVRVKLTDFVMPLKDPVTVIV
jgi:hypothetical protein